MRALLSTLLICAPASAWADDLFISADEAKSLVGKPEVRFVCSDTVKECQRGHLPGAVFAFSHDLQFLDDVKSCKGLPMCEPRWASSSGA